MSTLSSMDSSATSSSDVFDDDECSDETTSGSLSMVTNELYRSSTEYGGDNRIRWRRISTLTIVGIFLFIGSILFMGCIVVLALVRVYHDTNESYDYIFAYKMVEDGSVKTSIQTTNVLLNGYDDLIFEDDQGIGNYHLLSSTEEMEGKEELYEVHAQCCCDEVDRKAIPAICFGISTLVWAITSISAFNQAKDYLSLQCKSKCGHGYATLKYRDTQEVFLELHSRYRFECNGNCMVATDLYDSSLRLEADRQGCVHRRVRQQIEVNTRDVGSVETTLYDTVLKMAEARFYARALAPYCYNTSEYPTPDKKKHRLCSANKSTVTCKLLEHIG